MNNYNEEDQTMLKAKVNVDITNVEYPIYFERKNECVCCGAEDQLTFVNIFGRETDKEVHPFDHIKCKQCGAIYSIKWDRDGESGKLYPSAIDPSIKNEFVNLVGNKVIKQKGEKVWLD